MEVYLVYGRRSQRHFLGSPRPARLDTFEGEEQYLSIPTLDDIYSQ